MSLHEFYNYSIEELLIKLYYYIQMEQQRTRTQYEVARYQAFKNLQNNPWVSKEDKQNIKLTDITLFPWEEDEFQQNNLEKLKRLKEKTNLIRSN